MLAWDATANAGTIQCLSFAFLMLLAVSPEALRLDAAHDREALRNWFTFLAET